ncbi:serine/threonine protein kinase [Sorangium sp. So ce131]|uniref:serine/threonine protein kinase n=1 Tax=Sorangium sp. So ce131 TaxID=3133282 RepID=UPI003F6136D0
MQILSELKPGDTLGRYEILMPVARGGMAAVWAARLVGSRGFQKIVAVKTMLPEFGDDPAFEAMFLDEARLASRIRHPHAVEIVELGDENGLLYIVMEWVDGDTISTLNKQVKSSGGVPLPILLRIASSICAGLHAAHELRDDEGKLVDLVHRDISPQNVMVSFDGIVKIVDFGVAKATGRLHETRVAGQLKGKIPYLSPEQLTSGKVDRRSDIFSLGVLLYTTLSGYHPFRGKTDAKTMENILRYAPVPLRELVPDVPFDLALAIERALAKDPADRWNDCASFQRTLDQIAISLGTPVTDGDVGRFVRDTLGSIVEERRKKLAAAIQVADSRHSARPPVGAGAGAAGAQRGDRRGKQAPAAPAGSTPLPATFAGILPVALDDAPPKSAARSLPASGLGVPVASAPPSLVTPSPRPRRRWRRRVFLAVLMLVLLISGAALAARAGLLPVPGEVHDLLRDGRGLLRSAREALRALFERLSALLAE